MKYKVQITKRAKKYLDRLGEKTKHKINKELRQLIEYYEGKNVPLPDVKMLKGDYHGLLRLRISDIRVIFKIEHQRFIILIIDIVPRGDAYK